MANAKRKALPKKLRFDKLKDFLCDYMSFDEVEDIKDIVKSSRNWTDLRESLYEYFDVSEGL